MRDVFRPIVPYDADFFIRTLIQFSILAAYALIAILIHKLILDLCAPNEAPAQTEHLNIKVTDNNNEVFFKIKKSTKLEKLMGAFCERQGKTVNSVRFLFEGQRVQPNDTPDTLEMQDGDTLEVHQEQVGGSGIF
ncbi:putative ubiquitin-like modifier [Diaporthe ampelina]|uniref:Putative ubiquitin-like modifier n=1 Tax=Diaporthe ampelina TaxID=1214573 RepID=A0A0G2HQK1_9PEZI|nr:putative ubiquitin-like modifier [Diaporthe ampelina]